MEIDLQEWVASAHARWPELRDDPEWAAVLATQAGEGQAAHRDDLLLAVACSRGVPRALAQLEAMLAAIGEDLARRQCKRTDADEVLQRLRERLLTAPGGGKLPISDYAGRGPLRAWLWVAALRTLSNLRREDSSPTDRIALRAEASAIVRADPELLVLKSREREALSEAIRAAFTDLTPQERNLLRMHLIEQLGLDRLSRLLNVHRATAARQVASARSKLRRGVLQRIETRLGPLGGDLQTWVRLVRSQLGISVRELLQEPAA